VGSARAANVALRAAMVMANPTANLTYGLHTYETLARQAAVHWAGEDKRSVGRRW
jgi:hypothetical protein